MVNYKIVIGAFAVLSLQIAVAIAAPKFKNDSEFFDQRQNGSDNIRVKTDSFLVVVAPAKTFVAALKEAHMDYVLNKMMELMYELEPELDSSTVSKPASVITSNTVKPQESTLEGIETPEGWLSDVSVKPETGEQKKDSELLYSGEKQKIEDSS